MKLTKANTLYKLSEPALIGGAGTGIVTSGLVLHLDAGDSNSYPGSGTTWSDLSDTGDDFTLINSPSFSSDHGGEFLFENSDDKAQADNPSSSAAGAIASAGTIQFWFRTLNGTIGGNYARVISISNSLTANNDYSSFLGIIHSGSSETMEIWYKSNPTGFGGTSTLNDNNYHNLAWTWATSGSSMTFNSYINGVNTGTTTRTNSPYNSANADIITLAARNTGGDNADCALSVITMYNFELSAEQILQNYNAHKDRHSSS